MEDAKTNAEVTSTLVAKADGAAGVFGNALGAGVEASRCCGPLPTGATRVAPALVGGCQMRERVRLLVPVCTP